MRAARALPSSNLAYAGLAKIATALPAYEVRDLLRFLDCLHVGHFSPREDLSDTGVVDAGLPPAFGLVFLRRQHVRFACRDATWCNTLREVEPQAMPILLPVWYLVGWCPARSGFRQFRMDRMRRPEAL